MEGVDDVDKAASFSGSAAPRRSTQTLDVYERPIATRRQRALQTGKLAPMGIHAAAGGVGRGHNSPCAFAPTSSLDSLRLFAEVQ
jgi:hypothetical protein